jgi:hypothetical protein
MRMLVSVEIADAGTMTGTHRVLVVGGCSDTTAPGDIGISLEEAKTLLSALKWQYVAAQAAEITEKARRCNRCGTCLSLKDWSRRTVHTLYGRVLQIRLSERQEGRPSSWQSPRSGADHRA